MRKYIFTILFFCLAGFVVDGRAQNNGTGGEIENDTKRQTEKTLKPLKTPENKSLQLTSKPRAFHTEAAKVNKIEGTVRLKVTFKKDGTIGKIKLMKGLPDGLSEQAIAAARKIRFTPAIKNGKSVTVTKTVDYTFTLY